MSERARDDFSRSSPYVYNKVKQLEHDVTETKKLERQILSELRA